MSGSPTLRTLEHPSEHVVQGLATAVEGVLWAFEPLRTTKSRVGVTADAAGGITLAGNVRSEMMKSIAGRLAGSVQGTTSVSNGLVSDAAIEARAAEALGAATIRLFTDQVDVESRLGTVYLGGRVATADQAGTRSAIEAAAGLIGALPGVHHVFNETVVVAAAADAAATSDSGSAPDASGAADPAIQERLRAWKERVRAA